MARRGRYRARGALTLLMALALVLIAAACAASPPPPPDIAADEDVAVTELLAAAGEVCAATSSGGAVTPDLTDQTVRSFEEVHLLGTLTLPPELNGGAHEQWWIRYLAVRRASLLELLDAAGQELLPSQQQDPTRWRAAAERFESGVDALGEHEQVELRTMRAGAAAVVELGHPASVLLREVERRLAVRLGLTVCNGRVLRESLEGDLSDPGDRRRISEMADLLVGEP